MPSPLGHALGALAVGWSAAGDKMDRARLLRQSAWIVAFGVAPDLDLLIGRHSMETHSIGAALLAGALAARFRWPLASTRSRIFVTATLAWASHPLLDAFGTDGSAPYGVMMWWPLSRDHILAASIFDPISRRWWLPGFVMSTLLAAGREVVILGPLTVAAWFASRRSGRAVRMSDGP